MRIGQRRGLWSLDGAQNLKIDDGVFDAERQIARDLKIDEGCQVARVSRSGDLEGTQNDISARDQDGDVTFFELELMQSGAESGTNGGRVLALVGGDLQGGTGHARNFG